MNINFVKDVNCNIYPQLAEMQNGRVHLENRLAVALEVESYSSHMSHSFNIHVFIKGKENTNTYTNVHSSFIYNCSQLEITQISKKEKIVKHTEDELL